MVQINFALREVNCKIVYYGPGMSGKTTNLEIVHKKAPESNKGELTSIATEGDRTLFFDFMPLDLGTIAGMRTRFQLYTVPGQVYYNSTRKLVLQGVDGIIFVADSQVSKMEENLESLENLKNNLAEYGKDIREIPLIIQYNKRDLPDAAPVEEMNARMNPWGVPYFEAVAITGEGVFPTLKCLSGMVLETLNRDERETPVAGGAAQAAPAAVGAPSAAAAPKSGPVIGSAKVTQGYSSSHMPAQASGPAPPSIRSGSTLDQLQHSGGPGQQAPPQGGGQPAVSRSAPQVTGPTGGGGGGNGWGPPRKVEASPLDQSIRTTGPVQGGHPMGGGAHPGGSGAPRQISIREEKGFPWMAIALGVMILLAAAVILHFTGYLSLPF